MFDPWQGANYSNGGIFKKKILILGESHYCDSPEECTKCKKEQDGHCELTVKVIKDQITEGEKKHAIFTKLAKLCIGKADGISPQEKIDFWNSVAFYNYVQISVADKARVAPTPQMWSDSEKAFEEVMETLKPDFLLILGSRLWNNLPGKAGDDWPSGQKISYNSITENTWYYKGTRKDTLSLAICHPSSSWFSYDYIPIVKEALALS